MTEADAGMAAWSDPEPERLADGVHRLPLPLPGDALKAVNVYVLADDTGITLVDAGWDDEPSWKQLAQGLRELGLDVADVRRVLVTHLHADHVGQATTLHRRVGADLWLGERERRAYEHMAADVADSIEYQYAHLARSGAAALVPELRRWETVTSLDWDLPQRWLLDGDRLPTGARELEVVPTPGHTRGHLSFLDRATGLLFAGDHLLPHITPSIGFEPHASDRALADFLGSLARVRALPVERVLPAHGPVFADLAGRVDELAAHHDRRLARSRAAVAPSGSSGWDVAQELGWTRRERAFADLDVFNRMLAVWETQAHLDLLAARGEVVEEEVDGVRCYRPAA